MGSIVGRSTTLDIFHCKSLRHLVEVSSLTENCRHGVPLVRRKEDLEQRGGEDIGIDDALTGESSFCVLYIVTYSTLVFTIKAHLRANKTFFFV